MNKLFNSLGGRAKVQKSPTELMNEFRNSDPINILRHLGYRIPENMNDPHQVVDHLLNTGQVLPAQMQRIQQTASRFSAGAHAVD